MRSTTRHPILAAGLFMIVALAFAPALTLVATPHPAAAAGLVAGDAELLENELERTELVLERVDDLVVEANSPRMQSLYQEARKLQSRAWELFRRDVGAASMSRGEKMQILQLTRRARDMARRIQRDARENVTMEEKARLTIERVRGFLDRIGDQPAASDSPQVRAGVGEARNQLEKAERQFADGNFSVAFRLAESAQNILRDLVQDARQNASPERVEQQLHRTDELLQRAAARAGDMGDEAQRALDRAQAVQQRAREAYQAGRLGMALDLTQDARNILRSLLERASGQVGAEDVERALGRFDARMESVLDRSGGTPTGAVGDLVEQAAQSRQRATSAQAQGDYTAALTHVRVGLDLLNRAAQMQGGE